MKIMTPISSFLLIITSYYLKGIQWSLSSSLAELYVIDGVSKQFRLRMIGYSHSIFNVVIVVALVAIALAVATIRNKSRWYKVIGVLLLIFSILSFLCSLIRV
jgi:hypothetical protein